MRQSLTILESNRVRSLNRLLRSALYGKLENLLATIERDRQRVVSEFHVSVAEGGWWQLKRLPGSKQEDVVDQFQRALVSAGTTDCDDNSPRISGLHENRSVK